MGRGRRYPGPTADDIAARITPAEVDLWWAMRLHFGSPRAAITHLGCGLRAWDNFRSGCGRAGDAQRIRAKLLAWAASDDGVKAQAALKESLGQNGPKDGAR